MGCRPFWDTSSEAGWFASGRRRQQGPWWGRAGSPRRLPMRPPRLWRSHRAPGTPAPWPPPRRAPRFQFRRRTSRWVEWNSSAERNGSPSPWCQGSRRDVPHPQPSFTSYKAIVNWWLDTDKHRKCLQQPEQEGFKIRKKNFKYIK